MHLEEQVQKLYNNLCTRTDLIFEERKAGNGRRILFSDRDNLISTGFDVSPDNKLRGPYVIPYAPPQSKLGLGREFYEISKDGAVGVLALNGSIAYEGNEIVHYTYLGLGITAFVTGLIRAKRLHDKALAINVPIVSSIHTKAYKEIKSRDELIEYLNKLYNFTHNP